MCATHTRPLEQSIDRSQSTYILCIPPDLLRSHECQAKAWTLEFQEAQVVLWLPAQHGHIDLSQSHAADLGLWITCPDGLTKHPWVECCGSQHFLDYNSILRKTSSSLMKIPAERALLFCIKIGWGGSGEHLLTHIWGTPPHPQHYLEH